MSRDAHPQRDDAIWKWRNNPTAGEPSSPTGRQVTIQVPPGTDIWRPARDKHVFSAPFLYTTLGREDFVRVRVSVSAPWKTLFDQGGLVISFPPCAGEPESNIRFIKAGIEVFGGESQLGVVGTDALSDWSLSPILHRDTHEGNVQATILIERDGADAWVYVLEGPPENRTRRPLRQVTWAFGSDHPDRGARDIEVGVYGAKPTREPGEGHEGDGIAVTLREFELKTVAPR